MKGSIIAAFVAITALLINGIGAAQQSQEQLLGDASYTPAWTKGKSGTQVLANTSQDICSARIVVADGSAQKWAYRPHPEFPSTARTIRLYMDAYSGRLYLQAIGTLVNPSWDEDTKRANCPYYAWRHLVNDCRTDKGSCDENSKPPDKRPPPPPTPSVSLVRSVCAGTSLSYGWVISTTFRDIRVCGWTGGNNYNHNVWQIVDVRGFRSGSQLQVCAFSPIPENFIVTARQQNFGGCLPNRDNNGPSNLNIQTIYRR